MNPDATAQVDTRSPAQIIESIQEQGRVVNDALARLSALLEATPGSRSSMEIRTETKRTRPGLEVAKV